MGGGYLNKPNKTTKFETLNNKSIYKKLALLFVAVFLVASVYFKTSSAKYKVTQEVQIVNGNIKANLADLNIIGIYVKEKQNGEYIPSKNNQVPTGNYELDLDMTSCTIDNIKDNNITFEYRDGKIGVSGVSQSKTKCNIYLKKLPSSTDAITEQVVAGAVQPNFKNISCLNGTNNGRYATGNCYEETNGVYAQETSLGTTYYFRGTVNNNWVKFGKMNETKEVWAGGSDYSSNYKYYLSDEKCNNATSYNKNCTKVYSSSEGDDIWWRIIRINEDGTVRLIYAGTGTKEDVASPNKVNEDGGYWMSDSYGINNTGYDFNTIDDYNANVGYMYGTPGSTISDGCDEICAYRKEHGYDLIDEGKQDDLHSSTAKTEIDSWYEANLLDDVAISDGINMLSGRTGFCGDRSLGTYIGRDGDYTNKGYGQEKTYYKTHDRVGWESAKYQPSYECSNPGYDLYTTKNDRGEGNGALTYPIGLITADEVVYAGGKSITENYGYWLYTGQDQWTFSLESYYSGTNAFAFYVQSSGYLANHSVIYAIGLRPVVNLKPEYFKTDGHDGTIDNPYIASAT